VPRCSTWPRRWPEVADRRQLLLRLAETGHEVVSAELAAGGRAERPRRQHQPLRRVAELVDTDALLCDTLAQVLSLRALRV